MKVFIIGPENSGKTVFAAMFNRYIGHSSSGNIEFRASDARTKKYFATTINTLEQEEWPISTKQGKLIELNWEWLYDNQISSIKLIDPPGQDIRSELNGNSNALDIVNRIKEADLLIIVVDLYGHQSADSNKKTENAWIVEHTLRLVTDRQSVILALSKADLLTELPEKQWNNRNVMLGLLQKHMPEFSYSGYKNILTSSSCSVIAFSSVLTKNITGPGTLNRWPVVPLTSNGFGNFANSIIGALNKERKLIEADKRALEEAYQTATQAEKWINTKKMLKKSFWVGISILMIIFLVTSCPRYEEITCSTCSGNRTIVSTCPDCKGKSPTWLIDNCSTCKSTGNVNIKCVQCNGTGQIGRWK